MKIHDDTMKQEGRIDEVINIVEKHTRTARHLENYSDIIAPEEMAHTKEIQKKREDDIRAIKNKIVYGTGESIDEMSNIRENLKFSEGYLNNNFDTMNPEDRENLETHIKNRKEKLNMR
ncbi:hypothetical protein [Clostridium cellulovorans]|uniref:Uncharacterized protein n=1 Tax=Clostridium cellulovorans (strain ATCC 35296 / DSM 3052 / OCM 3 / 743B) TaxID=573061 RepID=D9SS48_CLOC7|nr:hypothetical protein [Clostridium cellulovorans]ADL52495.1 hypothetical protein Clocel_2798 [Clostridium cellulovorans 743B]